MLDAVSSLILLISSLTSAVWLLHQHKKAIEEHHFRIRVFALSCFFIGGYALSNLLLGDENQHANTLLQMTENLTIYVSIPFIATVFIAMSKGWHWSMAGWGRWLLGLIAFFELTRRTDFGVSYTYTLAILAIAALLLSVLPKQSTRSRNALLIGTVMLSIGSLLYSPLPLLMEEGHSVLYRLSLAITLPLLMISLHWRVSEAGSPKNQ